MARFLATQIRLGKITEDQVPDKYWNEVYAILEKEV